MLDNVQSQAPTKDASKGKDARQSATDIHSSTKSKEILEDPFGQISLICLRCQTRNDRTMRVAKPVRKQSATKSIFESQT